MVRLSVTVTSAGFRRLALRERDGVSGSEDGCGVSPGIQMESSKNAKDTSCMYTQRGVGGQT